MAGLKSKKQILFVQEYLVDLNATQAAIRAGYAKKRADQIGYENLRKPDIQAAIQEAMQERSEKTGVTQEMVIEGLLKEARDEENGSPAARVSAWEKLGKHLGIFEKDNDQRNSPTRIVIKRKSRDGEDD